MIEFSLNITEVDSDLPAHVERWFVPGARALGSLWAGPPPGGYPRGLGPLWGSLD